MTHLSKTGAFMSNFIHYFILFKGRKSPTPESKLFVVKERLEGLKYKIDFLGEGVEVHRGRGRLCQLFKKGPFYRSVSTLLSLTVAGSGFKATLTDPYLPSKNVVPQN